jgi:hypothetical protein
MRERHGECLIIDFGEVECRNAALGSKRGNAATRLAKVMKSKLVQMIAIFAVIAAEACAQETVSTNDAHQHIIFLIKATNETIVSGATTLLSASITNQTTNLIYIHESDYPLVDSRVFLTDNSGTVHEITVKELTSPVRPIFRNLFLDIPAGGARQYTISIPPVPELAPGIYKLRVKRTIFLTGFGEKVPDDKVEIESNVLSVELKDGTAK